MSTQAWVSRGAVALVVTVAVSINEATDDALLADLCYLGVLVGAGIGAWVGAERAQPGHQLVPRLIAAGLCLNAVGETLWVLLDRQGAYTDVSVADPPWLLSYVLLGAAMWLVLSRSRSRGRGRVDLDLVVDVVTIAVVTVLIVWSSAVDAIIADSSVSPLVRSVWASYPVADAILLALVVRVLMSRRACAAIDAAFAVGVCLWLGADIAFLQAPEHGVTLALMDAAWMVAPALMAHAAWRDEQPTTDDPEVLTPGGWVPQLLIAVCPLFTPPALELVSDLRGKGDRPLQLLVGMTTLILLAFVRTARLLRSEQRAQRDLEIARDAALEVSRIKSLFVANMSHEIRTPLTTVLATAEMLQDTPLSDVQLRLLSKMHRSGALLKTLVDRTLDFSRMEAGEVQLQLTEFDLDSLVVDIAEIYGPRAEQRNIGFDWLMDPRIPHEVVGDPARIFQVLTNLLDNALKFTHEGQVVLGVRGDGDGPVTFSVTDTGIGIREEDQVSLFDSFRQVDASTTRRYEGSGLGLAICKQLAEVMGGSVTVWSRYGVGSRVDFRVPLSPAAPSLMGVTQRQDAVAGGDHSHDVAAVATCGLLPGHPSTPPVGSV